MESYPGIDPQQSFAMVKGKGYYLLKFHPVYGAQLTHLHNDTIPDSDVVKRYLTGNHKLRMAVLRLGQIDTKSLRDVLPRLRKVAVKLDIDCFLSENYLVLLNEHHIGIISEETFQRCRKGLQASVFMDVETDEPIDMSKLLDVDALVDYIEGTPIKTSDPKKAAKKARQKEKKEMERQRIADEKAKEEKMKQEELRQLELEVEDFIQQQRRSEDKVLEREDDILGKQKGPADMKKEEQKNEKRKLKKEAKKQHREQRRKELEGGEDHEEEKETKTAQDCHELIAMAEPKRGREDKRAAKETAEIDSEKNFGRIKYEKEQRKREEEEARRLEQLQAHARAKANKKNKKKKQKQQRYYSESNSQSASDGSDQGCQNDSSNYHNTSESRSLPVGAYILHLLKTKSSRSQGKDDERSNLVTMKKPMDHSEKISKEGEKDLIYTPMNGQVHPTNNDGHIRTEDALPPQQTAFVKPETIRPNHIRTPSDNGGYQYATPAKAMGYTVYPTNNDAHTRFDDILPVQQTAFFKLETVRANHISTPPATANSENEGYIYGNPVKAMGYRGQSHGGGTYPSPIMSDNSALGEIGLSQRKLPPGFNITNVPQHLTGLRGENMYCMQIPDYQPKQVQSSMNEYARSSSMSGTDTGYNPNVVVGNSRCSSLESPVIGIQPSDVMYGAYGTRPSSEAPVGYDHPNSGMDSAGHNDMSPYAPRPAFYSNEMLHARGPTFLSSPFESSSSGLARDYNSSINGTPGVIPSTSPARPNGQGLWSSTPASPVASSATEILRAQGQRLKFRNVGFGVIGEGSSSSEITSEVGMMPQKTGQFNQSASVPANPHSYAVGSTKNNGSYASRVQSGSSGTREVTLPSHSRINDPWYPWGSPSSTCQSMKPLQVIGDNSLSWEPGLCQPQHDKETGNLTVNPHGPIGSYISRSSSSDASNGMNQNDKPTGPPRSNDATFWSYN